MANTGPKVFLIGFNIIFFLLGVVLLSMGIYVLVASPDMMNVMSRVPDEGEAIDDVQDKPSLLEQAAKALIAAGAFVLVLGFLGCCGAWKEVRLFLGLYAIFVFIILIIEVAGAAIVFLYEAKVDKAMMSYLNRTIVFKYHKGLRYENNNLKLPENPIDLAWDTAQIALSCCGSEGPEDWQHAQRWNNSYERPAGGTPWIAEVPLSCCKVSNPKVFPGKLKELTFVDIPNCLAGPDASNANMKGCYGSLKDAIKYMAKLLQIFGLVVAVIEIIGIASAIYLCVKLGRGGQRS